MAFCCQVASIPPKSSDPLPIASRPSRVRPCEVGISSHPSHTCTDGSFPWMDPGGWPGGFPALLLSESVIFPPSFTLSHPPSPTQNSIYRFRARHGDLVSGSAHSVARIHPGSFTFWRDVPPPLSTRAGTCCSSTNPFESTAPISDYLSLSPSVLIDTAGPRSPSIYPLPQSECALHLSGPGSQAPLVSLSARLTYDRGQSSIRAPPAEEVSHPFSPCPIS